MTLLNITDGITNVNLIWHNTANRSFMLARDAWEPTIAARRTSELGGRSSYNDVVEEIGVHVLGDSPIAVLSNLAALAGLIDQADRWSEGDPVNPVTMQYTPTGGTRLSQALIVGRASGDETSGVSLPVTTNSDLGGYMISDVKLRLKRRGLWITSSDTASSSSGANPTVLSAALPSTSIASPLRLDVAFPSKSNNPSSSVLIVSNSASLINLYEAEALADGAKWTSFADAANKARGGSVLRYTPTDTSVQSSLGLDISGITDANATFEIYAAVRNNAASSYLLQAVFYNASVDEQSTPPTLIDASVATPRIVCLGSMPNRLMSGKGRAATMCLRAQSLGAAGSLDIDYFVLVGTNNECTKAVLLGTALFSLFTTTATIQIDPSPLAFDAPFVNVYKTGSGAAPLPPYSDAYLMHSGTTVYALWLGTGGNAAANWRYADGAGTVVANTITAMRYSADLVAR